MQKKRKSTRTEREINTPPERGGAVAEKISVFDAIRAFGVMAGPSMLFDLFLLGSVVATIRHTLTRPRMHGSRLMRPLTSLGTVLAVAYPVTIRPWMLRWGATDDERQKPLPGDGLVADPVITSTRAVTVDVPRDAVWPWLAQIGQDRGGFYSYEWLENLAGCKMQNADCIHPEWQQRTIGDVVKLHWAMGKVVTYFEPNRAIVLAGWGAFVVDSLDDDHTRVILRGRKTWDWPVLYDILLIELPHFLMERKMLLGLKKRAEQTWQQEIARSHLPDATVSHHT